MPLNLNAALRLPATNSAKFSRSSRRLVVVENRDISLWDVAGQNRLARYRHVDVLEQAFHLACSPVENLVLLKNIHGWLALFDISSGQVLATTEGQVEGCRAVFSTDGTCVIDGTWEGMITVRDAATLAENFELENKSSMITDLDLHGNALVVLRDPLNADGTKGRQSVLDFMTLVGHTLETQSSCRLQNDPNAVRWRPDGSALAVCGFSEITLLDRNGKVMAAAELEAAVGALAWSPDGQYVVCDNGGGFSIFRAPLLEPVGGVPMDMACAAEFSPDGKYLLLGSGEKDVGYVVPFADILSAF